MGGVSWYEAAAYARWAGKSLPTIYHWSRAADQRLSGDVVPASNLAAKNCCRLDERAASPAAARPHGRQREGVVLQRVRREAVHPGRRVERAGVHVHGCRRTAAVRAQCDVRLSLHQDRPRRGPPRRAHRGCGTAVARSAERAARERCGLSRMAEHVLVRSRQSEREGRGRGRLFAGVAHRAGELRGRVRRRAHARLSVHPEAGEAAVPGDRLFPGSGVISQRSRRPPPTSSA